MPAVDTNVRVRYVVQDDSAHAAAAKRLIDRCVQEGQSLDVPVTVTLEREWVLPASFGFVKDDVRLVLSKRFSAAERVFQSERALEVALQLYRKGTADFADCLHTAWATVGSRQPSSERSLESPPSLGCIAVGLTGNTHGGRA